jgi:hypothetical protein
MIFAFRRLSDNYRFPVKLVRQYPHSQNRCNEFLLVITELRRFPKLLLTAVVMLFAFAAHGQELPPAGTVDATNGSVQANPGRPTVSTPATLTPVGYVQLETGALGAEKSGEFSNRTGIEAVLKLSLTQRFELVALTEPTVISDLGHKGDSEPGEVFTGLQALVHQGEHGWPAISVSYFRRLYASPAPELDIGTNRQSALLLVSFDVHRFHFDTNAIVTEQISDAGRHRAQIGQTLSISHPLLWHLTFSSEIWHFSQPLSGSNALGLLLAPSYAVNRYLVLDGGINRGLTPTSTRWEIFMGATYLFPKRLW